MATFKVVIADPATGKCEQKEVEGDGAKALLGKKIGESVPGDAFDLKGKTLVVTGGSDYCGFPMRADLPGAQRKRILITKSTGFRGGFKGMRKRKTVAGNTIHAKTHQVNLKIQVDKPKKAEKQAKESTKKAPAKKAASPAKKKATKATAKKDSSKGKKK